MVLNTSMRTFNVYKYDFIIVYFGRQVEYDGVYAVPADIRKSVEGYIPNS